MQEVLSKVQAWREAQKAVALCVVVRVEGRSPRDVGSLMAVNAAGEIAGSISAGCAEGVVLQSAVACIKSGQSELVTFTKPDDKVWEAGLPCGGDVDVCVMPYDEDVHDEMMRLLKQGQSFTYVAYLPGDTPFSGMQAVVCEDTVARSWMDDMALEEALEVARCEYGIKSGIHSVLGAKVFVCHYEKRPQVVCVGAVHISACLSSMANVLGYDVVVVDPRSAFLQEERFGGVKSLEHGWPQEVFPRLAIDKDTAVCVLSHDEKIDVAALHEALATDAFYIGCLGHAETLYERRCALAQMGDTDEDQLARIFGPIGIYIGGRAPADIALSILAQIQAVRHGRITHAVSMPGHRLHEFTQEVIQAREVERRCKIEQV